MHLLLIFSIWLIISLAIGVYGRISLRDFSIYISTSLLFVFILSCVFYLSWNFAIYHVVTLFISKKVSTISFYSSLFGGAIAILIFALNYLWFKCSVRKSDKKDLTEVMNGLKEIRIYVEQIESEIRNREKNGIENTKIRRQILNVREKLLNLEKLITPWLLRRL